MINENSLTSFVLWCLGAAAILAALQWLDLPVSLAAFIYVVVGFFGLMALAHGFDWASEQITRRRLTRLATLAARAAPADVTAARRLIGRMLTRRTSLPPHQPFLDALATPGPIRADLMRLVFRRGSHVDHAYWDAFDEGLDVLDDDDLPDLLDWLRRACVSHRHPRIEQFASLGERIARRASPAVRPAITRTLLQAAPREPTDAWLHLFRALEEDMLAIEHTDLTSFLADKREEYHQAVAGDSLPRASRDHPLPTTPDPST